MPQPRKRENLATLIDDFAGHDGDVAIVSMHGVRRARTSYRELAQLAYRFGAELEAREIRKGDRVLIWGENCAEWVAAFFGCVARGVLPVPLDAAGSLDFAQRVAADVKPRLVVGDGQKVSALGLPAIGFAEFASRISARTAPAIADLNCSDALQIIFTSGTTGTPKGIVHTHGNVLASLEPIEREMAKYLKYERPFHPVRILHTLPLSHVFGQFMGLWTPPLMASELHYETRLVARELVRKIQQDRISVLAGVPRLLDLLSQYALERFPGLEARIEQAAGMKAWQRWWHFRDVHRAFGFKFWAFVVGGASLAPGGEQFWQRLGFVVVQGYGMTETTALVSLNHPFHAAAGTIGQVLPGREVKLGEDGEVLVRGATISNSVWQGGRVAERDSEWLHTGDLAEFDAQGNLKFRGRKKEVIVTAAGLNIYPEDLEAALNRQAGVKASAVVEAESGNGPEPVAVLVLATGTAVESVVEAANATLAPYQQMRRFQVWPQPDFPRTSTGKILKREIVLNAAAQTGTGELHLDSLGMVELQAQVEQRYGVTLNDADMATIRTQDDLNALISRGSSVEQCTSPLIYWKFPWNPVLQFGRAIFIEAIAMPVLRLLAKPKRTAPEELPSPALIICNHVTSYDAPFVLYALPGRMRRRVAIAMSGEMMADYRRGKPNILFAAAYWLITVLFNVFPLPRSTGFKESFKHAGEAIDRGYSVLVFPEGHRSDDGRPQPFRAGSGLLWKELGVPVIPVRIDGLGELKRDSTRRWFRSGTLAVQVGAPLKLDAAASTDELTERMRRAVFGPENHNL